MKKSGKNVYAVAAFDEPTCPKAAEYYRRQDLWRNHEFETLLIHDCLLTPDQAVDVSAMTMENLAVACGRRRGGVGAGSAAVDPAAHVAAVRAAVDQQKQLAAAGVLSLRRYAKNHGNYWLAERCLWLLLENYEIAGTDSLNGLVNWWRGQATTKKERRSAKQTVNACLKHFQAQLPKLQRLPEQRGEPACQNMVVARLEQMPATGKDMRLHKALVESANGLPEPSRQ